MAVTNVFRSMLRMFTTKGDLIAFDGTDNVRVPVGSDDQVLTADSSAAAGVSWQAASGGGVGPLERQGVLAPHANLRIENNATNPAFQMDITADALIVTDGSGNQIKLSSISETVDLTASGAGGLDTGSEAADTWYHLWVIHDASGPTTAALLSTSSTSPTMPSGYTYKGYVGAIRNDGSDFRTTRQRGMVAAGDLSAASKVLDGGTATGLTSVSLAAAIPETAGKINCFCRVFRPSGSGIGNGRIQLTSDDVGFVGLNQIGYNLMAESDRIEGTVVLPIFLDQTFYYRVSGAGENASVWITSWEYV